MDSHLIDKARNSGADCVVLLPDGCTRRDIIKDLTYKYVFVTERREFQSIRDCGTMRRAAL